MYVLFLARDLNFLGSFLQHLEYNLLLKKYFFLKKLKV